MNKHFILICTRRKFLQINWLPIRFLATLESPNHQTNLTSASKHKRLKTFLERKYQRLVEEAYNLKYTDAGTSDILTYEALKLDQKLKFLQF